MLGQAFDVNIVVSPIKLAFFDLIKALNECLLQEPGRVASSLSVFPQLSCFQLFTWPTLIFYSSLSSRADVAWPWKSAKKCRAIRLQKTFITSPSSSYYYQRPSPCFSAFTFIPPYWYGKKQRQAERGHYLRLFSSLLYASCPYSYVE